MQCWAAVVPRPQQPDALARDHGLRGRRRRIHIQVGQPSSGRDLDITPHGNTVLLSLRCSSERGFALLTQRWCTLQHITASPGKIGGIARTALVPTHFEYGYIKCYSLRLRQHAIVSQWSQNSPTLAPREDQ
jgi:hypothetical protein